jgi:hypothetical protein
MRLAETSSTMIGGDPVPAIRDIVASSAEEGCAPQA